MLFQPSSIAVIGASPHPEKLGHHVLSNIVTQGYKGAIFPIHPKESELMGLAAYATVADVPHAIEMAIIVTPMNTVTSLAEECGKKGVRTLVVISAGFAETGTAEGREAEAALKNIVREYAMTLVGPNCLGILRPSLSLNASFAKRLPPNGNVALISQSGALAVALMDEAAHRGIGFSLVASIGNKTTMDESDFLSICESDPLTHSIGLYVESIKNGPLFHSLAARISQKKPIVLIKSGISKKGMRAVSSHTGSLAGNDAAIDALCRQSGMLRARSTEEFLDLLLVVSSQPPLLSSSIAIITNAGGPGVMASDAAERYKLTLANLDTHTKAILTRSLPLGASVENPIDVLGDSGTKRYEAAVNACAEDPNVDGLIVVLTPQVMTPAAEIATMLSSTRKRHPLMPIVTSFMGHESVQEARSLLAKEHIPCYETPERAVRALAALTPVTRSPKSPVAARAPLTSKTDVLANCDGLLSPKKTQELLALYDLPFPHEAVAKSVDEAATLGSSIGYPLIAKISSPDILHKTDIGGVKANIQNDRELAQAYNDIVSSVTRQRPDARIDGVLIQQFLPAGREFIVGSVRDDVFGSLVMVGLGGIYTELFADTSFRIAPISSKESYQMLTELKAWNMLMGLRGDVRYDTDALARIIEKVSAIVMDFPCIREIDMNPVIVYEKGVVIADVKVVVGKM